MGCLCVHAHALTIDVSHRPKVGYDELVISPGLFVQENLSKFSNVYHINKLLGRGLYTAVYECVHKRTEQTRAVKIVYKEKVDKDALEAGVILREVEIHKTLDHPNIVRLLEFFEDAQHYYFIQEYCSAGELFDMIIAKQKLSERESARIMQQLASAVAYLHSRGIIHRDIKPENVLLTEQGDVKLIDFDTAALMDVDRQVRGSVGTTFYMAPEVLHKGAYNEKCDIWSMGVVMYILLSGQPPFDGYTGKDIKSKVLHGTYSLDGPLWDTISAEAKDLIRKQMNPKPHMRISAQDVYLHPWIQNQADHICEADRSFVFENLRQFNSSTKLKEAVHTFICTHIINTQELKNLASMFKAYDHDGDGVLSREDLMKQFEVMMPRDRAVQEVNRIMKHVDTDSNGYIDYTEFLKATIDRQRLLSKSNLQLAFSTFDKFGTGYITADELKEWLANGSLMEDDRWGLLLEQIGLGGGAGVIDLKTFEKLLVTVIPGEGGDDEELCKLGL